MRASRRTDFTHIRACARSSSRHLGLYRKTNRRSLTAKIVRHRRALKHGSVSRSDLDELMRQKSQFDPADQFAAHRRQLNCHEFRYRKTKRCLHSAYNMAVRVLKEIWQHSMMAPLGEFHVQRCDVAPERQGHFILVTRFGKAIAETRLQFIFGVAPEIPLFIGIVAVAHQSPTVPRCNRCL